MICALKWLSAGGVTLLVSALGVALLLTLPWAAHAASIRLRTWERERGVAHWWRRVSPSVDRATAWALGILLVLLSLAALTTTTIQVFRAIYACDDCLPSVVQAPCLTQEERDRQQVQALCDAHSWTCDASSTEDP